MTPMACRGTLVPSSEAPQPSYPPKGCRGCAKCRACHRAGFTFKCLTCRRMVAYCFGAGDSPDCDACWVMVDLGRKESTW